jgi:hypothetical protein
VFQLVSKNISKSSILASASIERKIFITIPFLKNLQTKPDVHYLAVEFLTVQFHNVVGGFSPPFERSGGVAGTELEGRA